MWPTTTTTSYCYAVGVKADKRVGDHQGSEMKKVQNSDLQSAKPRTLPARSLNDKANLIQESPGRKLYMEMPLTLWYTIVVLGKSFITHYQFLFGHLRTIAADQT